MIYNSNGEEIWLPIEKGPGISVEFFVRQNIKKWRYIALKVVQNEADADDVVQIVLWRLTRRLRERDVSFQNVDHAFNSIAQGVKRCSWDWTKRKDHSSKIPLNKIKEPSEPGPEEILLHREKEKEEEEHKKTLLKKVKKKMKLLTPLQRRMIRMMLAKRMNLSQISKELNTNYRKVYRSWRDAKEKLEKND